MTPKIAEVPIGLTQQIEADAVLETGATVHVTTDSHLTWTSSDTTIATIDANGLVKGVTQGTVTITAEGINNDGSTVIDTATITVIDAVAVDLTVTPRTKIIALGLTQVYTAEVLMSDGRVINVTGNPNLTWSSSDVAIATISNATADKGIASGLEKGQTNITATGTVGSVSLTDTVTLTVSDAAIVDYIISPASTSIPVNFEQTFTAEVILADGTVQDVTELSTWITNNPTSATVSDTVGTKGIAQGRAVTPANSPVSISAEVNINGTAYSDSAALTVTDEAFVAFNVIPGTAEVPVELTQPFRAMATFDSGRVMDITESSFVSWTTTNTDIASVDNRANKGLAKGVSVGDVQVKATATVSGNTYQDSASLEVTSASIEAIQVTPATESTAIGLTKPFSATAILSDGTTRDITADPATSWSTDNHDIATISNHMGYQGIAKGESEGTSIVIASYNVGGTAKVGSATLTVTNATITAIQVEPATDSTPIGLTKPYTATAQMSDGTTQDITLDPSLSWMSSDSVIASISNGTNKGEALGESVGTATITATFKNVSTFEQGTATLNVTSAIVQSLSVTPNRKNVIVGLSRQFTATATLSDNSTLDVTNNAALSWSSSDTAIASIVSGQASGNGVARGESLGEVTITATGTVDGQTFSDTTTLTVIAADVVRLEVHPSTYTTPIGLTKSFTALAVLSNNTTIDVTNDAAINWTSSDPAIATINSGQASDNGVATGVSLGQVTITAQGSANGHTFSDTAYLDVSDAVITSLQVTPKVTTTPIGLTQQYTARALLSDGITTIDVTHSPAISWTSSDTTKATIAADGLATGVALGTTTITAQGTTPEGLVVSDSTTLDITDAVITSLQVTPASISTPIGLTKQFNAIALLSDGVTTLNVTDEPTVSWTTSDTSIATITSSQANGNGVAKGEALGTVIITAQGTTPEGTSVSGTATLSVTDAVVTGLQVTPPKATKPKG
ncbi:Ig-like domain-containing protein, partial [Vibrio alginolyticus]|nr:Ig-like domain-containing protein [Vibrio alginolyticus]